MFGYFNEMYSLICGLNQKILYLWTLIILISNNI